MISSASVHDEDAGRSSFQPFTLPQLSLGERGSPCSQILASLASEMQTPLDGLLGLVSQLRRTELDASQRRCVETIALSSSALMGLLAKMSTLARLESGDIRIDQAPVALDSLGFDAIAKCRVAAEAKGLHLAVDLGQGSHSVRLGDSARLSEVLGHLLDNAVKFTQAGRVTLFVERKGAEEEGVILFSVSDTGIGCPSEIVAAVHSVTDTAFPPHGSRYPVGLGLRLCLLLTKLMGGKLYAATEPGIGSTFTLEIPMGPDLGLSSSDLQAQGMEISVGRSA